MVFFNVLSYILAIVGGLNWGLFGIFNFNLVSWIFGGARTGGAITIYVLIALACLWLVISPMITGRGLLLAGEKKEQKRETAVETH